MKKLVLVLVAACGSDNPAPTVHVETTTPDRLTTSDDAANDVTITVSYDDADGDLGGGTAEVHDCRADALVTALSIPAIATPDLVAAKAPISGELDLFVNDVGGIAAAAMPATCSDLGVAPLAASTTVFCVILVDSAGHHGAGDCTPIVSLFP